MKNDLAITAAVALFMFAVFGGGQEDVHDDYPLFAARCITDCREGLKLGFWVRGTSCLPALGDFICGRRNSSWTPHRKRKGVN